MTSYEHKVKNIYLGEPGWSPGENTIFYANFNSGNIEAEVGTLQNSGATLAQDGTKNVLHINGRNCCKILSPTIYQKSWSNYTYNARVKSGTGSTECSVLGINDGYHQMDITTYTDNRIGAGCSEANIGYGTGAVNSATSGVWHNVVMVYLGNGVSDIYIDGAKVNTAQNPGNGYGNTGSGQRFGTDTSKYSTGDGYISDCIVESKARTAEEIENYYNQTKSNYGL